MPAFSNTLDHLGLTCPIDLVDEEVKFLNAALAPLGIKEQYRAMPSVVALGDTPKNTFLWVSGMKDRKPFEGPATPIHFAFKAPSQEAVDAFHKAGLAAGGKDNGPPGIREMYHPNYYAAFLISPCGHNVEAVIHDAPKKA